MPNGTPRIALQINPARLASIIDNAVIASNEIVNFHFNALTDADLTEPAQNTEVRFRVRGSEISAADRRSLHESWILAKAFQELLRAVRHSLEEAHVFVMLLTKVHSIKSDATLHEFISLLRKKAASLNFPKLLNAVNSKLDPKVEFSAAYVSLQVARNCLEHRAGIVSKIETHSKDSFVIRVPRMKMFYLRNNEEVELEPGHRVNPGDDRAHVDVLWKIEIRERSFKLGERLFFTLAEFNEISFACHFLGKQLSSRLPKPSIK